MNILILIFIPLFGLIIGSFLNCLTWRLHTGESMGGRSRCPKCKKQIAWYDNVPVLSFVLLRGKCRQCGEGISWQYPVVELVTGLLFLGAWVVNDGYGVLGGGNELWVMGYLRMIRDLFVIAVMIIVFIYDLRWYLILDVVTLPAALVVFGLNLLLGFNWYLLLISGIIGGSFFLMQFLISRGKWIGGGDIRLGLLMGLALGWPNVIIALFLAYFIGAAAGLIMIFAGKKQWGSKIPLGIFLSTGTVVTLFWGSEILSAYLDFIYR